MPEFQQCPPRHFSKIIQNLFELITLFWKVRNPKMSPRHKSEIVQNPFELITKHWYARVPKMSPQTFQKNYSKHVWTNYLVLESQSTQNVFPRHLSQIVAKPVWTNYQTQESHSNKNVPRHFDQQIQNSSEQTIFVCQSCPPDIKVK